MVDNVLEVGQGLATFVLGRVCRSRGVIDGVNEIAPSTEWVRVSLVLDFGRVWAKNEPPPKRVSPSWSTRPLRDTAPSG